MQNYNFNNIENLALLIHQDKQSEDYKNNLVYISMNFTRSYQGLRSMLPIYISGSRIERCRQRFIYKCLRKGWIDKIHLETKDPMEAFVEIILTILWAEGKVEKITASSKL